MGKSTCTIDGCDARALARGWCSRHWQRWKRHGDPLYERQLKRDGPCAVGGCDLPAAARGWCKTHHARWRRRGDVQADVPVRAASVDGLLCEAQGCVSAVVKGGFCLAHYKRWRRHGDPLGGRTARVPLPDRCMVEQCPSPPWARSYCRLHYDQDSRGVLHETERACALCGGTIGMFPTGMNGRKLRADVSVCTDCRRPRNPTTVSELRARDGDACGICGTPVDARRGHPDPLSPSVDHIVPYSRGGSNTADNCQLAHLICNLRKNNRTDYAPIA